MAQRPDGQAARVGFAQARVGWHGHRAPGTRAAATLVTLPAVTVPVLADEAAFARASGCMACHAVDRRMVGPSFRDISARYAGQADAVARMTTKIQRGG